jgi:hypothetical protein
LREGLFHLIGSLAVNDFAHPIRGVRPCGTRRWRSKNVPDVFVAWRMPCSNGSPLISK